MHKLVAGIIVTLAAVVAIFFIVMANNKEKTSEDSQSSPNTQSSDNESAVPSDAGDEEESSAATKVAIEDFTFTPATITVKKGTTVTWTNNDSAAHNVVGSEGGPKSSTLSKGDTYSFTFNKVGTFKYVCTFHAGMNGEVIVTE